MKNQMHGITSLAAVSGSVLFYAFCHAQTSMVQERKVARNPLLLLHPTLISSIIFFLIAFKIYRNGRNS